MNITRDHEYIHGSAMKSWDHDVMNTTKDHKYHECTQQELV
jgi:hypothetical protein